MQLIQQRLADGFSIDQTLQVLAPPGYSEHHTGRAIDITTSDIKRVQIEFENTKAFRWLCLHAGAFGFTMSYPENNASGYRYEPWHWCFVADQ